MSDKEYNKIGLWAKGYLEAVMNGDEVSKAQLETLIQKLKDMIAEQDDSDNDQDDSSTDDLPF